jgi:hypothetical protein
VLESCCQIMIIQNAANGWGQWFYTNAPAAWISSVVAISTLVYVLGSRNKPKRIVVREVSNGSVVRIWPSVRDKIAISFLGRLVQNLGQVDLEIFNEGSEVIEKPGIEISLQSGSMILDLFLSPPDPQAQIQVGTNKFVLVLPYLNPHREHKQIVKVSILLDGNADQVVVNGDGVGWSTRHVPLLNARQSRWFFWLSIGLSLSAGIYISVISLTARHLSLTKELLLGLPIGLFLLASFAALRRAKSYRQV